MYGSLAIHQYFFEGFGCSPPFKKPNGAKVARRLILFAFISNLLRLASVKLKCHGTNQEKWTQEG